MSSSIGCRKARYPPAIAPTTRNGSAPRSDRVGQRRVRRLVRQVLLAREEPHERPALLRARGRGSSRAASGSDASSASSTDALRDRPVDVDGHLAVDARQRPQMRGKDDADHGSVWTSTESTAGRSRTIGAQVSPASADAYTWPPVVPKYTPQESSESTAIASRRTFT